MLIGNVLEKTSAESAWELCADKLADRVRDAWLDNKKLGLTNWSEAFVEESTALAGLREEGFEGLVGLDYIFKWWGAADVEELAGEIDVIWKVATEEEIVCYRSWVKVAERDFILGIYREERAKREETRKAFRAAFAQWKDLFAKL